MATQKDQEIYTREYQLIIGLVRRTKASISLIADLFGISSAKSLGQLYKEHVGVGPTEDRRNLRQAGGEEIIGDDAPVAGPVLELGGKAVLLTTETREQLNAVRDLLLPEDQQWASSASLTEGQAYRYSNGTLVVLGLLQDGEFFNQGTSRFTGAQLRKKLRKLGVEDAAEQPEQGVLLTAALSGAAVV